MTTTDPKLIEPVVSHLANRFLQYPLPKDFMPDNGVSVQRPNYAPDVPWTIYGTNLLNAEQAKAMVRFMLEGAPVAAAINEAAHQWQDIATAPRDGEAILLYKPDERMVGEYIIAGYWGEWPGVGEGWIACDGKPQGYYSHTAEARQGFPTHWQPLPSPPAIEAHKENGHG